MEDKLGDAEEQLILTIEPLKEQLASQNDELERLKQEKRELDEHLQATSSKNGGDSHSETPGRYSFIRYINLQVPSTDLNLLKQQIQAKEEQIDELRQRCQTNDAELEKLKQKVEELTSELEEKNDEIDNLINDAPVGNPEEL